MTCMLPTHFDTQHHMVLQASLDIAMVVLEQSQIKSWMPKITWVAQVTSDTLGQSIPTSSYTQALSLNNQTSVRESLRENLRVSAHNLGVAPLKNEKHRMLRSSHTCLRPSLITMQGKIIFVCSHTHYLFKTE